MRAPLLVLIAGLLVRCAELPRPPPAAPVPQLVDDTAPVQIVVPPELQSCAAPAAIPPVPTLPRSIAQVLDWATKTAAVAMVNADNLAVCRRRLNRLNDLVERANK